MGINDVPTDPFIDEAGNWTIQVFYPNEVESNSQLLTEDDALIPLTETSDDLTVPETDNSLQQIYIIQDSHSSITNVVFACPKCEKMYNAKRNLVRHINSECGKEPKYSCAFCDYRNYRRNEIVNHIRKRHQLKDNMCLKIC